MIIIEYFIGFNISIKYLTDPARMDNYERNDLRRLFWGILL